jgi:uncharacterized protein YecE (DUF72 family)
MKYGLVDESELAKLDLHLPPDHPDTLEVLRNAKKPAQPAVYTGCAKWGRKEWEGQLYPEGIKEKDYLREYVRHFNSLELNSTFYSTKKDNIISWADQAPQGFKFSPKFNRRISHIKRLKVDDDFLDYFIHTTQLMGDKLGMAFLQMAENFTPKYLGRLDEFLEHVPDDYSMAVELRHEDWYKESEDFDATFEVLKRHKRPAVITDTAARRDVLHMRLTTPEVFVRFNGYGINQSTYDRIDEWVERLAKWIDLGVHTIYFFPHQEDETFTPLTCHYFIKKINRVCGLAIPLPKINEKAV